MDRKLLYRAAVFSIVLGLPIAVGGSSENIIETLLKSYKENPPSRKAEAWKLYLVRGLVLEGDGQGVSQRVKIERTKGPYKQRKGTEGRN